MKNKIMALALAFSLAMSGIAPTAEVKAEGIQEQSIGNASMESALQMELGQEYSAALEAGESAWYKFVPGEEGFYRFSSDGDSDTYGKLYVAESEDVEEIAKNDDGGYSSNFCIIYYLEAGKTYYLEAFEYEGEAATFSVIAEEKEAIANDNKETALGMELDEYYHVELGYNKKLEEGEHAWYKFTPEEDGIYVFSATRDAYGRLYSEEGEELISGNSSNFRIRYSLKEGQTYYLEVYNSSEECISSSISVEKKAVIENDSKETALEMELGENCYAQLEEGEHAWYKFTPEEEGLYVFSADGGAYEKLYDAEGEELVSDDSNNYRIKYDLETGKTYYLEVYNSSDECVYSYLNVKKKEGNLSKEAAMEMELGQEYSAELEYDSEQEEGEHAWYKFIPDAEGLYIFSATSDACGRLYSEEGEELIFDDSYNFRIKYRLEAGKTYYLEVCSAGDGYLSSSVSVKKKDENLSKETALEMELGQEYSAALEEGEYAWYKFVPEEEGIYIFSSSSNNDTYGKLYAAESEDIEELTRDDDGGDNSNFYIRYYLEADKTYYLEASGYSGYAAAFSVNVEKTAVEEFEIFYKRNISVTYGKSVTLKVGAVAPQGEQITYQWYKEGQEIEGAQSSSYVVPADNKERYYNCEVTCGDETRTAYFTLDIQTGLTVESNTGTANEWDDNYRDVELKYGEKIELSVTATGGVASLSYQWYYDYEEDIKIEGATGNSLSLDGTEQGGYYCEVTDGVAVKGIGFWVSIDTGFTANTESGEMYGYSSESRVVKAKSTEPITLTVTAESKLPITYEWSKYDETEYEYLPVECKESSYTLQEPDDGSYQCKVTDGIHTLTFTFRLLLDIDFVWNKDTRVLTIGGTGVIPREIVQYIGWSLYDEDDEVVPVDVDIKNGVTGIEARTFCWNAEDVSGNVVRNITIPASVTNIGEYAVGYYYYPWDDDEDGGYSNRYEVSRTCTIHCVEDSAAHTYAVDNGIAYELMTPATAVDISTCDTTLAEDSAVYTGTEIKPQVTVTNGTKVLRKGIDYDLSYKDNINVGNDAKVTVTGIGDYTGTVTKPFKITAKTLDDAGVSLATDSLVYTGAAIKPQVIVKDGEKALTEGTDYTLSCKNNINVGTTAEVTVTGKGNYTGTVKKTFKITAKTLANATVILTPSNCYYNGKACEPGVTVKLDGRTLKAGDDYGVTYNNNTNIGTALVTISGKNNYTGNATKPFSITVKKDSAYTIGAYKYKITSGSEVSFAGLKSKKTKKVSVPGTVKIGGKNFKVTSIDAKALKKTSVTSVTVGNNVKTIGNSAFEGCSKLTKVTIGTGVTKIGTSTFKSCKKLGSITIKSAKLKTVGKNALKGIKSNAKIKVPSKKLKDYNKLLKGKGQGKKVKITK